MSRVAYRVNTGVATSYPVAVQRRETVRDVLGGQPSYTCFTVDIRANVPDSYEVMLLCRGMIALMKDRSYCSDIQNTMDAIIDTLANELKDYI